MAHAITVSGLPERFAASSAEYCVGRLEQGVRALPKITRRTPEQARLFRSKVLFG
jgi:hypothetical protein